MKRTRICSFRATTVVLLGGVASVLGGIVTSALADEGIATMPPIAASSSSSFDQSQPLQWRGAMYVSRAWHFRLCDTATGAAAWLAVGDTCEDFVVRTYDAASDRLVVERHGVAMTLAMNDPGARTGLAQIGVSGTAAATKPRVDIATESRRFGIDRTFMSRR